MFLLVDNSAISNQIHFLPLVLQRLFVDFSFGDNYSNLRSDFCIRTSHKLTSANTLVVMKSYHLFYGFIISSSISVITNAYDIGCLYPRNAVDPWSLRETFSNFDQPFTETPQVVRGTHYWGMCQALCLHYHDPRVSNPNDYSKWRFTIPAFAQNAFSTIMCVAQCDAHVAQESGQETQFME